MVFFVSERSASGDNGQLQVDNEMSRTTTEALGSPQESRGRHHSGGSTSHRRPTSPTPRDRSRSPLRSSPKSTSCSPRPLSPSRVEQAEPAARYAAEHAIKVSSEQAKQSPPHSPKVPSQQQHTGNSSSLHQVATSTSSKLPPQASPGLKGQNGLPSGNPFDQQNPAAIASAIAAMQGQNPMQVRKKTSSSCSSLEV